IIFHRRWFFILPFVIVFCTATIGSFFLPKFYQSSVLILVEEEKPVNPLARELPYLTQGPAPTLAEQLKTLTEKILNYPHLIKLVRDLNLDKGVTDPSAYEKLIYGIRSRTEVKLKAPDVFQISYEDKDPKMARAIINTLIQIFIEENLSKKTGEAMLAVKFADEQAQLYKKKLEESERALFEFKSKYPLQLPGKEVDLNVSMLISYQTALTGVEMNLKEAANKIDLLKRQLAGQEAVIISTEMMDLNPAVANLNAKLQDLQSRRDTLMATNPDSPDLTDIEIEIEDVREKLRLETEKMVDSETAQTAPLFYQRLEQKLKDAQLEKENLIARKKELTNLVAEYEGKIESLPEQEKNLAHLTRDNEVNDNIYKMLRMKVEENRLTGEEVKEKGTKYTILEKARLPLKPSKPQILLTSIVAFVLGILSGFGCVFLTEFSDHSFRGVEDARLFLTLPILGSIPTIVDGDILQAMRRRQRRIAISMSVFFIVLFIIAIITSSIRQSKTTDEIIKTAIAEKEAENGKTHGE
ncbi:MAG: GNVR domain-containing protein, partial [Candidatus Omnitrophota bacterium]|nr:GNVR domain-containing protein [Candidatus Omnitrophota bacterium]